MRAASFIGRSRAPWRAHQGAERRRGVRPDCRVRARPGVGESSDGLAPRGRERKSKGGEMTGWAGGKGNGPAGGGVWVAGEEKEKGEVERAGPGERKRNRKVLHFF